MSMQLHPVTAEMLGAAHRADLEAEAHHSRLVGEARASRTAHLTPSLSRVTASRRRLVATIVAALMALGVVAGSVGANPTANANAAGGPAAADRPAGGGGMRLQR